MIRSCLSSRLPLSSSSSLLTCPWLLIEYCDIAAWPLLLLERTCAHLIAAAAGLELFWKL